MLLASFAFFWAWMQLKKETIAEGIKYCRISMCSEGNVCGVCYHAWCFFVSKVFLSGCHGVLSGFSPCKSMIFLMSTNQILMLKKRILKRASTRHSIRGQSCLVHGFPVQLGYFSTLIAYRIQMDCFVLSKAESEECILTFEKCAL